MSVFFCRGRNAGDSFVASFIRTPNPVTRTSNILDTRIRTAVSARAEQHLLDRPAVAHQRRQRRRPLRLRAQPPQHIPDPYRRVRGSRLSPPASEVSAALHLRNTAKDGGRLLPLRPLGRRRACQSPGAR